MEDDRWCKNNRESHVSLIGSLTKNNHASTVVASMYGRWQVVQKQLWATRLINRIPNQEQSRINRCLEDERWCKSAKAIVLHVSLNIKSLAIMTILLWLEVLLQITVMETSSLIFISSDNNSQPAHIIVPHFCQLGKLICTSKLELSMYSMYSFNLLFKCTLSTYSLLMYSFNLLFQLNVLFQPTLF